MNNSFYIPIHSMNLAHYLGSGIIVPSIYIENKNSDIQDRFKNHLLLSSSKFTKDTNCAIEIVLNTDQEEIPKKISENFYLFDMPLPISRIKGIYFNDEEKKIGSHFDITSGTAFIPDRLLKVSEDESIDTKELENINYKSSDQNWSGILKKYDQILGGFSTMKISKENFQNYPTHYFSTLGNLNNLFSNILAQQNVSIENSFQFAFTDEGKFKNFHNTIYSEINHNEVQQYAKNDKVKIEVKNGLIQIDKISENTQTYLVAILESYGKGKRKQVDSFISDLISGKFVEKKKEGLSLIFGLNKGYKAFRNKYKTSNFEVDIKFKLDNKLDYYIIESVYQNVFNSLTSISSFKYIDKLFLESKKEETKSSKYVTYQMIDETIILEKIIPTPLEKILEKISDIISKWFPFSVKKNEIESIFKASIEYFKTEIESDLANKFNAELEQNKTLIEQLKNTISGKEKITNQLENQLTADSQLKMEIETSLKVDIENYKEKLEKNKIEIIELKSIISDKEKTIEQLGSQTKEKSVNKEKLKEEDKEENAVSNEQIIKLSKQSLESEKSTSSYDVQKSNTDLVNEGSSTLFSDDNSISSTKLRERELKRKTVKELKSIAEQYKIQKISSLKKDELIDRMIKYESKQ